MEDAALRELNLLFPSLVVPAGEWAEQIVLPVSGQVAGRIHCQTNIRISYATV